MEEATGQSVADLRDYWRALWRHRLLILVTTAVAICAALGFSALQTREYDATTQLVLQSSSPLGSLQPTTQDPVRNVDSEIAVLQGNAVESAALKKLGHRFHVSVSSTDTSNVVNVTAQSSTAKGAADDANGYAATYVDVRQAQDLAEVTAASHQVEAKVAAITASVKGLASGSPQLLAAEQRLAPLQQQLDQLQLSTELSQPGQPQIVTAATVPAAPTTPKPVRNAGIAVALGLLLGICLAFAREYFDDSIVSRADLERASDNLPVLVEIPKVRDWHDRTLTYVATRDAPRSLAAESYLSLRTSLQFIAVDHALNSVQITSAQTSDGKTTTIVNLAVAFARTGRKVIIVCADLRRPRAHEFFGLTNRIGITSIYLNRSSLENAIQPVRGEPNLALLAAGPPPPNPSELLSSAWALELIACVGSCCDLVLVDSPPVLPVGDALIVSGMVDATLLVASANSSSRRATQRSVEMLRQVHAPLIGTVLNNADSIESYGSSEYGYLDLNLPAEPSG